MIKLYIIVRTDLASMTPGRIAAQCAHAANQFVAEANQLIECIEDKNDRFVKNFKEWENQTDDHYGTTIVLNGGTEMDIRSKVHEVNDNYLCSFVIDPEYPLKDGNSHTWTLKDVLTCAFFFQFGTDDSGLKDMKLL